MLDRWHIGEAVWPKIFDRDTDYDNAVRTHVELFLRSRGALLVLAQAPLGRMVERTKVAARSGRLEPVRSVDGVAAVLSEFRLAAKRSGHETVDYDFDEADPAKFSLDVLAAAGRLEDEAAPAFEVTSEWLGEPRPDALLVAERPGGGPGSQPPNAEVPLPPFKRASGHALFRSLPTRRVAVVNAYQRSGAPTELFKFWDAVGRPATAALGNVAHEQLNGFGVPHGVAPHPQYIRRFWAERVGADYAAAIGEAIFGQDARKTFRNPGGKS